jgi:hypothetical protein
MAEAMKNLFDFATWYQHVNRFGPFQVTQHVAVK